MVVAAPRVPRLITAINSAMLVDRLVTGDVFLLTGELGREWVSRFCSRSAHPFHPASVLKGGWCCTRKDGADS